MLAYRVHLVARAACCLALCCALPALASITPAPAPVASDALAAAFDRAFARMRQDGTFARLTSSCLGLDALEP